MSVPRAWLLVCLLCLAACSPGFLPDGFRSRSPDATPPLSPAAPTPTPTPAFPPRPTPVYTPQVFPSCESDPVPALQLEPLPTPAAGPAPAASDVDATLRSLAGRRGLLVGAAADPAYFNDPAYTGLLARQFNLLAAENAFRWDAVHPELGRYDFSRGDALAAYARANGLALYGHALVWDQELPAWLTDETRSREAWIQLLCRHVKTVAGRYRGQVYAWTVVNEPFQNDGQLRNTLWMRVIGPEYIAMAFQWAREADPDALLILNEHSAEGMNEKSQAVYAFVAGLLQQGLPIDGVGLQMHVWLWGPPTRDELLANMRRLAQLGLQAHITAMDVRTQYSQESRERELAAQAETYRQALLACLSAPNCNVFTVWGLTDRVSWIPALTGTPDAPLLFDAAGAPKPAFDLLIDVLKNGY